MDSKAVAIGFLLYFATNAFVALFLSGFAAMIWGVFGILGTLAIVLGSSIVSFPVLILVFYIANRMGVEGDIPEVSY